MHFNATASIRLQGAVDVDMPLAAMGIVLATACGALALGRVRAEGRNVQVIAPMFLAAGICVVHLIGMAAMEISTDPSVAIPPQTIQPAILGFFATAMAMLLVGTGLATTLIARGARLEAQTQLRNIADASIEGLILTDGTTILDFNESIRTLVGPKCSEKLRSTGIWDILDYRGIRTLDRFEAHLLSDGDPIPVEVLARQTQADGAVRRIFAIRDLRERRAAEQRITYLAHFDTLTGLPNRASFQDRLENDIAAASARNGQLALMILDLDRFKEINDLYGHAAGTNSSRRPPHVLPLSCRTMSSPPG
jgi:predicted signal transduction protein with EAL and GGDEF domain